MVWYSIKFCNYNYVCLKFGKLYLQWWLIFGNFDNDSNFVHFNFSHKNLITISFFSNYEINISLVIMIIIFVFSLMSSVLSSVGGGGGTSIVANK